MEKTKLIQKYELMLIIDAHLTKEDKDNIIKEIDNEIVKFGGKVVNSQVWFEKQKFTFDINKKTEGTYHLINFEADKSVNAKLNASLRLNEKILRSLILEVENYATKEQIVQV